MFLLLGLFWGGSFLAINQSLKGYSPFLAATLRTAFAFALTLIYVYFRKTKFPKKKYLILGILNGVVGLGLPWAFLFWAEQFVAPAMSAILNATAPIFTAIFAAIIIGGKEKMTWNRSLGVFLGFAGMAVIFGPAVTLGKTTDISGLMALVGMAVCYAISIAWLKKLSPHISNIVAIALECIGGLVILIPIMLIHGFMHGFLTGGDLLIPSLAIAYLGFFSTFLAYILFYKLLTEVGTMQAAAVTYITPIISILLDWLFLDKWIGNHALLGALIVFAAIRVINRPTVTVID